MRAMKLTRATTEKMMVSLISLPSSELVGEGVVESTVFKMVVKSMILRHETESEKKGK